MRDHTEIDSVIIGAGLAGLACACGLQAAGRRFSICEAADRVGCRVARDIVEGYRLDRGFQVLLTAYPEARRWLHYEALDLCRFYPGALVRHGGRWHRVADPFRHPIDLTVLSAVSPYYAPPGRHLISISVVDPEAAAAEDLEERVRRQWVDWFGVCTKAWALLRIDRIPVAVPSQRVAEEKCVRVRRGLYQCGDHCGIASIDTALASDTAAAQAVLEDSP